MKILEYIKQILLGNKKTATIYTKKLTKKYGELTPLSIGLYDHKEPLPNRTILINVNGKDYERKTNEQGIAILNINLPPGEYTPLITFADDDYNLTTAFTKIEITTDTYVDGINLTKTFGDNTPYQCAVYDKYTGQRIAGTVNLTINGKTYARTPDITGLYKLNINLNPGTYTLKAEYLGDTIHLPSAITNTITINQPPEPEPEPEPQQLWDYITDQGPGELGQRTGYTCGPHSLMQCIYRLTGIELSEMELASICGTTSDGTDHDGLATGLAWFNRKYGYNLKMVWKNFSEVGFDGTQEAIENGACLHHINYRDKYGHYEVPKWTAGDPIYVLNSLGNSCGGGYCGYVEERTRSEHQSYINGISQKSVCILTR